MFRRLAIVNPSQQTTHRGEMKMKMKLTVRDNTIVDLAYDDVEGERIERMFMVPGTESGVGYVHEWVRGEWTQVCKRLYCSGSTLRSTKEDLPELIRREYRAMRRDEKKFWEAA